LRVFVAHALAPPTTPTDGSNQPCQCAVFLPPHGISMVRAAHKHRKSRPSPRLGISIDRAGRGLEESGLFFWGGARAAGMLRGQLQQPATKRELSASGVREAHGRLATSSAKRLPSPCRRVVVPTTRLEIARVSAIARWPESRGQLARASSSWVRHSVEQVSSRSASALVSRLRPRLVAGGG